MKKIILFFTFCFTVLFSTQSVAISPFSISESQVNHYLQKKGEIKDSVGIPGLLAVDYQLKNLQTKIGQHNSQRVEINGDLEGIFTVNMKKKNVKMNLTLDAIPYYSPEKGAVYLKELRVTRWSGEPKEAMEQLQGVMPLLNQGIAALVEVWPVYQLDESNMRDVLIKKFAKGIRVEQGQLSLEANLF